MTESSFIHRVEEILWSARKASKTFTHDDARILLIEAYNHHVMGMEQEDAEKDAEFMVEEFQGRAAAKAA